MYSFRSVLISTPNQPKVLSLQTGSTCLSFPFEAQIRRLTVGGRQFVARDLTDLPLSSTN